MASCKPTNLTTSSHLPLYITTERKDDYLTITDAIYVMPAPTDHCFTHHSNCTKSRCLIYNTCTNLYLDLPDFTGDLLITADTYPELFI